MVFNELKRSSQAYSPTFITKEIISHSMAKKINSILFFFLLTSSFISAALFLLGSHLPDEIVRFEYKAYGSSAILFAVWSLSFAFYTFLNYHRFLDIALTDRKRKEKGIKVSLEAGEILYSTEENDLTAWFMLSDFGSTVLTRCGVPMESVNSFIEERKRPFSSADLPSIDKGFVTPYEYIEALYQNDDEFSNFIFRSGLQEDEFMGAVRWLSDLFIKTRKKERWWSSENLSQMEPIGTDWSYGVAYELKKFSQPIESLVYVSESLENFHKKEIDDLEIILSRTEGANALLVGEAGTGKLSVVGGLASRINSEKTTDSLLHKKMIVMNCGSLVSSTEDRQTFETEMITIMDQIAKAGNVILIIDNFPYLIQGARSLGSDITDLIDNYLDSSSVNILALSDRNNFHNTIEPNTAFMSRFEYVLLDEMKDDSVLSTLENRLLALEHQNGIMFTYPAVISIVRSAVRYFPSGVMPDKAIDLLVEIIPFVKSKGLDTVTRKDVDDFVRKKTGIPVGSVTEEEKGTLSNLEDILHKKVIGQNQAIEMVSSALRRARSGISNPDRPLGSFLFLGPTGVGKTETAKALAEIFFESSENMSRLDMSEYQGPEAISHLVGSFESGRIGSLASALREKPYSVLLLDEFEKADKDIHNLFLQTLDEGVFSDPSGKEVNARNSIIIATSNAGSDLIWEYESKGENLKEKTDDIINAVIERGILTPELLNRFDGVIVFHSLKYEHLRKIAKIKVDDLKERTRSRGVEVNVSDEVIDDLIKTYTDHKFGARGLNRAIQDTLENVIAKKIIEENPSPGSTIDISLQDTKDAPNPTPPPPKKV